MSTAAALLDTAAADLSAAVALLEMAAADLLSATAEAASALDDAARAAVLPAAAAAALVVLTAALALAVTATLALALVVVVFLAARASRMGPSAPGTSRRASDSWASGVADTSAEEKEPTRTARVRAEGVCILKRVGRRRGVRGWTGGAIGVEWRVDAVWR